MHEPILAMKLNKDYLTILKVTVNPKYQRSFNVELGQIKLRLN